jgi:CcmD family protein
MREATFTWERRLLRGLAVCGLALAMVGAPIRVVAQPRTPPAAQDGFVPMSEVPQDEKLPAAPLVFGAYSVIWLALLVYVAGLWRRLGTVERELQELKRPAGRR